MISMVSQALRLRKEGKTYREIAEELGVSPSSACLYCNPEKKEAYNTKRRNNEKLKENNRAYNRNRQGTKEHKEYMRLYAKNRREADPHFKLTTNLRGRLSHLIRGKLKAGSAVSDLGCSIEFLKEHLESQFQEGMSWDNYGTHGWHIDHIQPLASFDLEDKEQFLQACHYTNLQPLWAEDNLKKGSKVNEAFT